MISERAVPFASKPPEGWDDHVEAMHATRMFLLQTMGPTRFVVRGEDSDRKYTVLIGSRQRCSCGISLCVHHLFVMLKVLKVPQTSPSAWQTSLIDSEVDSILTSVGKASWNREIVSGSRPKFLRRGSGRTSAGGGVAKDEDSSGGQSREEGGEGGTNEGFRRPDIVPGEVCPVCQEDMMEVEGEATGIHAGMSSLTFCREGCGNNMHARCMLMYAEHRRSSGDQPCCPLCRMDWGPAAIRALKETQRDRGRKGKRGQQNQGVMGGNGKGGKQRLDSVTCRSCGVNVQATFFRCLVCVPAGAWDLCRRCYAGYANSERGLCTPAGRRRHYFVQGEAGPDPPEWKAAEPPETQRHGGITGGSGVIRRTTAGLLSLQGRDITTADFELLLTLDTSATLALHEHLLRALPLQHQGIDRQPNAKVTLPPANTTATHQSTTAQHQPPADGAIPSTENTEIDPTGVGENLSADRATSLPIQTLRTVTETGLLSTAMGPVSGNSDASSFPKCCCCSVRETKSHGTSDAGVGGTIERVPLRRLPCGHHGHNACLIHIILEGVSRGDPAECSCPRDGRALFPALARRGIRTNGGGGKPGLRTSLGSEERDYLTMAAGTAAELLRQSPIAITVAGNKETLLPATSSRHARAAAVREEMRQGRNRHGVDGGGDVHGLMLIGSGVIRAATTSAATETHSEGGPSGDTVNGEAIADEGISASGSRLNRRRRNLARENSRNRTLSAPEARLSIGDLSDLSRDSGDRTHSSEVLGGHGTSGDHDLGRISVTSLIAGERSNTASNDSSGHRQGVTGGFRGTRTVGRWRRPNCAVPSSLKRSDGGGGIFEGDGVAGHASAENISRVGLGHSGDSTVRGNGVDLPAGSGRGDAALELSLTSFGLAGYGIGSNRRGVIGTRKSNGGEKSAPMRAAPISGTRRINLTVPTALVCDSPTFINSSDAAPNSASIHEIGQDSGPNVDANTERASVR